jgi:succinate dehydrogenase / fumarate reductase flavoprotein subunit
MGGIPTNQKTEVLVGEGDEVLPGLYAAGEVGCVSVHGANRLGTNSLLDLVVFGRDAGVFAAEYAKGASFTSLPEEPEGPVRQELERLRGADGSESASQLRHEMEETMFDNVGVFRTEERMNKAVAKIGELKERYQHVKTGDTGQVFNMDLLQTWELGCLLDIAEVTAVSAVARTESRGAHARDDYRERDDDNWLKHTMAYMKPEGGVELRYKPVTITKFEPKRRSY